ncbi:hypothetical protein WN51_10799 [Melipona quadrifasciata]|uniref:Uncharacterized protein n=1 Tax=Melipona quadrifasciata TaxID=166423 RepID=A0A0M9A6I8_9HYME|nr:hypothetical protein WN51_10799 [Melipona quadrifasciata]
MARRMKPLPIEETKKKKRTGRRLRVLAASRTPRSWPVRRHHPTTTMCWCGDGGDDDGDGGGDGGSDVDILEPAHRHYLCGNIFTFGQCTFQSLIERLFIKWSTPHHFTILCFFPALCKMEVNLDQQIATDQTVFLDLKSKGFGSRDLHSTEKNTQRILELSEKSLEGMRVLAEDLTVQQPKNPPPLPPPPPPPPPPTPPPLPPPPPTPPPVNAAVAAQPPAAGDGPTTELWRWWKPTNESPGTPAQITMLIVVAVLSAHIPESFLPPPPGFRLLQFGQVEISAGGVPSETTMTDLVMVVCLVRQPISAMWTVLRLLVVGVKARTDASRVTERTRFMHDDDDDDDDDEDEDEDDEDDDDEVNDNKASAAVVASGRFAPDVDDHHDHEEHGRRGERGREASGRRRRGRRGRGRRRRRRRGEEGEDQEVVAAFKCCDTKNSLTWNYQVPVVLLKMTGNHLMKIKMYGDITDHRKTIRSCNDHDPRSPPIRKSSFSPDVGERVPFDPENVTLPSEISRWPPCAPMMSINSSGWQERAATVDNNEFHYLNNFECLWCLPVKTMKQLLEQLENTIPVSNR